MWPFKKKTDTSEPTKPESNQEEFKPNVSKGIIFSIEATKRMLEKKASEVQKEVAPDDPKPITPGEKLECPSCNQIIEKYSKRGKCPLCKNWVHYFNGQLYTPEESRRVKDEFYNSRFRKRVMDEALANLGITEEMMQDREKKMVGSSGMQTSRASVFNSLFNESILKVKDLREMELRQEDGIHVLNQMGADSFALQKARAMTQLARLKKDKFKKVRIYAHGTCDACAALSGKVMTIEEAKKTLPVPIRDECQNRREGEKYAMCFCSYEGEMDDEFLNKII